MNENNDTFPVELWAALTYWQRKRIYYLARWYVFKFNLKKFFSDLIVQAKAFLQRRST